MRKRRTISVAAALLLGACGEDGRQHASAAQLPEYAVEVARPVVGDVTEYREWVGRLEGLVSAAVLPQVSGYVQERLFTNGATVQAGEVLYRINPELYEQALAEAEQREAQARAAETEAAQHLAYNEPLVREGAISRQTYTDARQQLLSAQASHAAASAATAQARTNLSYCTLRSPVAGIVGFARADVGSYVSPGGSPLVTVNTLNPIRVLFSISAQDWLSQGGADGALRPGAKVELVLPNGVVYGEPAVIQGVDNAVAASTGTLQLDARLPNPESLLRPGMFVRVRAAVDKQQRAMMVPVEAVISIQGKNLLAVADDKGGATLVPVNTGLQQKGLVAVQGALTPDSAVVVKGTQQAMLAAAGRARITWQKK